MEKTRDLAVHVFADVDDDLCAGRTTPTITRYAQARRRLAAWLDVHGEESLETGTVALLAAEREFGAAGAYLRVASVEDVIYALPDFVRQIPSSYAVVDGQEARAMLRYVTTFTRFAVRAGHVNSYDHACCLLDLREAVHATRRVVGGR